ncbi:MAG: hypothetical protein V4569_11920 [Pseudomonadota bacterium]
MIKSLVLAAVTTAGALVATSANAGVSWSVNVNTPIVGTVISGGPGYYGYGDGYDYGRVYAPAPVYRVRPPVAYYPQAVVYSPVPVVYPRYYPSYRAGWRHGDRYDHRHDRRWDGHGRR